MAPTPDITNNGYYQIHDSTGGGPRVPQSITQAKQQGARSALSPHKPIPSAGDRKGKV